MDTWVDEKGGKTDKNDRGWMGGVKGCRCVKMHGKVSTMSGYWKVRCTRRAAERKGVDGSKDEQMY